MKYQDQNGSRVVALDRLAEGEDPSARRRRGASHGTTRCEVCGRQTTFRKPFCIDHLDSLPYASTVSGKLSAIEVEVAAALRPTRRRKSYDGFVLDEVVVQLAVGGGKTARRFALELRRDFGLPPELVDSYLKELERRGLVSLTLSHDRQGRTFCRVALTDDGRAAADSLLERTSA